MAESSADIIGEAGQSAVSSGQDSFFRLGGLLSRTQYVTEKYSMAPRMASSYQ